MTAATATRKSSARKGSRKTAPAPVVTLGDLPEGTTGEAQIVASDAGETVEVAPVEVPVVAFSQRLIAALTARAAEVESKDTDLALSAARSGKVAVDVCMSQPAFELIADNLLRGMRQAHASEGKQSFIAVKVLVKLVKLMQAIGAKSPSYLDPYTRTIVANMIHLHIQQGQGLSNKGTLVSLSRNVEFDELDQVQLIKTRYYCAPSTASTQASSTRMALHYAGIAQVVKGRQSDVTSFYENARAQALTDLFPQSMVDAELSGEHDSDE